jgi:putative MATE family efflux protein
MTQSVVGRASVATGKEPSRTSTGTLLKYLFALSLPVLAEHVLHILVGLNDTYLANHLPTNRAEATAAVGTVQYLFWFIGLFAGAIGTGSTAIIARAAGAKHRRRANSACGQSMLFALFTGLALGVLVFLFPKTVADFTGLQGQAHAYALSYLRMLSPAVPCVIVMMVANACLRGTGDTITPAIAMIVVDVVNIFFSWSLTFGWFGFSKLGFNGIAIGTVIAYIAGGILQVIVLFVGRGGIRLHFHRLRPHWYDMKRILNIGLPNAGESLINWIANFSLVNIVNRTAPINVAAAAHNNAIRIESISYMTGFAFSVAVATMVGQSLGMKDPQRAKRCAYLGYLVGGGFMTLAGVFFIFFSALPARFISEDPGIRDLTAQCLHITGFCQIGFAAAIIFGGALRGAGDTWSVMFISLVSVIFLRLGGVAIVGGWLHQPLPIIWIILASDLFVRGVLIYARFLQGGWRKIEV